ncbi:MAG: LysM peptidoglycan-binding domain-containing protein, partial [Flavobacteriales bacterium]|nr:LysM peptidoglycan-binding domain-containing protein [Flavobacteriales bacterium]
FLLHEVKKKETLYSISRLYNLDVYELSAANPGSDKGVKKGEVLRIPVKTKALANYQIHTVKAGETLYSLAKSYSITRDELIAANPGLSESLQVGQQINIPANAVYQPPVDTTSAVTAKVPVLGDVFQDNYTVALMLPFFSAYSDSSSLREKDHMLRDVALNMYRGALLATDTLSARGFSADLYVYDVLEGTTMVKNVLDKSEMKEVDIVIGPTYRDALAEVSKWSVRNGVHVVCPVLQPNAILLSAPNTSKAWPSSISQWEYVAEYVAAHHKGDKVILANTGNLEDKKRIEAFHRKYIELTGDSAVEFVAASGSLYGINAKLSASGTNVIIAPTGDQAMASSLFKGIKSSENTILFATPEWANYDFLEADDRNKLRLHYPSVVALDYADPATEAWVLAFRKKFKSEPTEYAVLAYDLMLYYCQGLKQFGKAFPDWFNEVDTTGLIGAGFDFIKTGSESGYENRHVAIMGTVEGEVKVMNK